MSKPLHAALLASSLGAAACGGSTSTAPADPAAVVFGMFEAVADDQALKQPVVTRAH